MPSTGEVSGLTPPTDRTVVAERRRFVVAVVVFVVAFTVVGRMYGEHIALQLQRTPTTASGWRLAGWLIAGPPWVVTLIVWHERSRLTPGQQRLRDLLVAAWIGLNMLVLPARFGGVEHQFGTAALVGDPLSAGWAWGAVAAVIGGVFGAVVLLVLRRTVERPTADQWDLTVRFLECAWVVLLLVSLGLALYGGHTGVFQVGA